MILPRCKYFFLCCLKINAYHLLFMSDSSISGLKDLSRFKRKSSELFSFLSSSLCSTSSSVDSFMGSKISFLSMLSSDSLSLKVSCFLVFLFSLLHSKMDFDFRFSLSPCSYLSKYGVVLSHDT